MKHSQQSKVTHAYIWITTPADNDSNSSKHASESSLSFPSRSWPEQWRVRHSIKEKGPKGYGATRWGWRAWLAPCQTGPGRFYHKHWITKNMSHCRWHNNNETELPHPPVVATVVAESEHLFIYLIKNRQTIGGKKEKEPRMTICAISTPTRSATHRLFAATGQPNNLLKGILYGPRKFFGVYVFCFYFYFDPFFLISETPICSNLITTGGTMVFFLEKA